MAAYDAEHTQPYRRDRQLLRQLEIVRREELGGPVAQQDKAMGRNLAIRAATCRVFLQRLPFRETESHPSRPEVLGQSPIIASQ